MRALTVAIFCALTPPVTCSSSNVTTFVSPACAEPTNAPLKTARTTAMASECVTHRELDVEEELHHVAVADLVIAADGAHATSALDLVQIPGLDELVR